MDLAAQYDRKIIVEEAVDAREIECAVIGNDEPKPVFRVSMLSTTKRRDSLITPRSMPTPGHVEFVVPAPLSKSMMSRIQRMAIQAFKSVDGAGLARVDFFLTRDGRNCW